MEAIRDTCLNILDDCHYVGVNTRAMRISEVLDECHSGQMDFSDIVLREHCLREGFSLMTDDLDYLGCGLDLITANPRMLGR